MWSLSRPRPVLPALLALALPATVVGQQQPDWSAVQIRTQEVGPGVYVLFGQGGNMAVSVGADGAYLVDDQFAPLTTKIRAAIAALTDQPVRFVVNTHWHGDHTGGNENFGQSGSFLVAHQNVRRRLNPAEFKDLMGSTQQAPPDALPVLTFTSELTFHWNGETIHVFHVPRSHTDGDAIIHFIRADVIHMGDTFFNGRYPFIDTQSGGTVQGMIASSELVLGMLGPRTRLIPGHGDVTDAAGLRAYRDMLVTARDRIAPMVARGMSADAVVAAKPTADLDTTWGANSERFVRAVYTSLAEQ